MQVTAVSTDATWVAGLIGHHDLSHPREAGLHLYDILHDLLTTVYPERFGRKQSDEDDQAFRLRIATGLAYEEMLARALSVTHGDDRFIRPPQAQQDGVWCSADELDLEEYRVGEIKATWMSCRQEINDPKFWHWTVQLKAYCLVWGTTLGRIRAMHLCGDYSYPIRPQWRTYDVEFTPGELRENWSMLLNHARRRGWIQ